VKNTTVLLARLSAVVALTLTGVARAAGGGDADHGAPHVANWWGMGAEYAETPALGWLACTFVVFVALLVYFGARQLREHLETRADAVEKAIAEATKAKEAALARARDAEAKLAALDGEVKKMKADFEVQGKAEAERIEAAAAELAKKVARDTEDMVTAEMERAREALRAEAARLALQLAEDRIKQLLTPSDDSRLRGSLVRDLQA